MFVEWGYLHLLHLGMTTRFMHVISFPCLAKVSGDWEWKTAELHPFMSFTTTL